MVARARDYDYFLHQIIILCVMCFAISIDCDNRGNAVASTFNEVFAVSRGSGPVNMVEGGEGVQLVLTQQSASGFTSINKYLFGSISMRLKLVGGNSAGIVTAYYLSSSTDKHDEADFEFLGNSSGEPYIVQTNVFADGVGGREVRHYLWFDPTADFHTYTILWNHQHIVFWVDAIPIRVFANNEAKGMPYPNKQAMRVYASLWNADDWATQGGRVKTDWAGAPFMASFDRFQIEACVWPDSLSDESQPPPACASTSSSSPSSVPAANSTASTNSWWERPPYLALSPLQLSKLRWVQDHYLVYHYCTDILRYPQPPLECPPPPS